MHARCTARHGGAGEHTHGGALTTDRTPATKKERGYAARWERGEGGGRLTAGVLDEDGTASDEEGDGAVVDPRRADGGEEERRP